MTSLDQRDSPFVLRIWWEETDGQPGSRRLWRGWVQPTCPSEATHVQDLEELLAFIGHHTGPLAQTQSAAPDRSKGEVMMNDQ